MNRARLSVVVITHNEARLIEDCLRSVQWADEIVVLDSGSTDDTVARCRRFTPHVHVTDWPGFGPQKNRAIDHATGEWVLSIDADETVSPELRASIEIVLTQAHSPVAYEIERLSSFCGRPMRHSGWWPDPVLRLFRRGQARFSDDLVHEKVLTNGGAIGRLSGLLMHQSVRSIEQSLDKANRYSSAGAQMQQVRGKRSGLGKAIVHGLWAFMRVYVFKRGFLDGREGFVLAVLNAEGTYYKYLKLMYLTDPPKP